MTAILDASAMLALIFAERGAEIVAPVAKGSLILAINFSEVVARVIAIEGDPERAGVAAERLGIKVVPFDRKLAILTAEIRERTSSIGASLADRACLAFTCDRELAVFTADRRWSELDLPIDIRQIRT